MTYAVPLKLRVRLIVFDKEDKGPRRKSWTCESRKSMSANFRL